jgi:hypothetical protein
VRVLSTGLPFFLLRNERLSLDYKSLNYAHGIKQQHVRRITLLAPLQRQSLLQMIFNAELGTVERGSSSITVPQFMSSALRTASSVAIEQCSHERVCRFF